MDRCWKERETETIPKKMSTAKDTKREVTKEVQMDNTYTIVSKLKDVFKKAIKLAKIKQK